MSDPKIKTQVHYVNEWSAIDDNTYDGPGGMIGWGRTEQEAIDDLLEQFDEQES